MLNQQTIEKLHTMRMRGMAEAFTQQQEDPQTTQLSFEERFALLVDRQWNWRQNRALEKRIRDARLKGPACIEDIDLGTPAPTYLYSRPDRDRKNVSSAGIRPESLPGRVHRLLCHSRPFVPRT
jgi:hypothetical protein